MLELSKRDNFCILPFISLQTFPNSLSPCCKLPFSTPFDHKNYQTDVEKYFNSPELKNLQDSFLAGEVPKACAKCFLADGNNNLYPKEKAREFEILVKNINVDPIIEEPTILFLNMITSSSCNLACRMCFPNSSSSLLKEWDDELQELTGIQNRKEFPLRLAETADFIEHSMNDPKFTNAKLVVITGGEPLIHPSTIECAEKFINNGCKKVWVTSSLSTDKFNFIERFDKIPSDATTFKGITVSLDGDSDTHRYVRQNLSISEFERNAKILRDAKTLKKTVCFTPSAINIHRVFEMMEYAYDLFDNDFTFRMSFVENWYLRANVLPVALRVDILKELESKYLEMNFWKFKDAINASKHAKTVIDHLISSLDEPFDLNAFSTFLNYVDHLDKKYGTNIDSIFPRLKLYRSS